MSQYRSASYIAAAILLAGKDPGPVQVAELAGDIFNEMVADDVRDQDVAEELKATRGEE